MDVDDFTLKVFRMEIAAGHTTFSVERVARLIDALTESRAALAAEREHVRRLSLIVRAGERCAEYL